jgi:hypothetical protein
MVGHAEQDLIAPPLPYTLLGSEHQAEVESHQAELHGGN